jgi:prolyl-tRNA synthetase
MESLMRVSQFFISTLKEAPAEAELISHQAHVARRTYPPS